MPGAAEGPVVVRVLPDVRGLAKTFDYTLPPGADGVRPGAEVRIELNGRRVGGWVVDVGVEPPAGVKLAAVAKVRGIGPAPDTIDLARWAAWRWAGPVSSFLSTASPPGAVRALGDPAPPPPPVSVVAVGDRGLAADALALDVSVVRLPPSTDRFPFVAEVVASALRTGDGPRSALVVCPSVDAARRLTGRLRRAGLPTALVADDRPGTATAREWARAAAGGHVVVGARAAAWAPAPRLAAAVVVDEHDEALQEERAPTWHARDVVLERARRAGVAAILVSPCPTLEALAAGHLLEPSRSVEREGWPVVDVVDRRGEDPATARSLLSPRLAEAVGRGGRVVCLLNRTGRARLLACRSCDDLARCEACGAAVGQHDDGRLTCRRCGTSRPAVCQACGSGALKIVRQGVGRLAEELSALAGEPVEEITASTEGDPGSRVVIGTEAALHRIHRADVVAFCDFDQELSAPRFRAGEQALALLARAGRIVGGRRGGGRVLVQTRLPDHPVVRAALLADPGALAAQEAEMRAALRFPPASALADVSGPGAAAFVDALRTGPAGAALDHMGPVEGSWLLRAPDHRVLCDALAAADRPAARLRIEVDPLRA